ncbi:MAG: aldo/keto reductase [Mesorhizobium sp.]|uniref:aldo/keto reductase n=1 Tax=Mesorhizobium sp. TaxID=1871066 RepID=UPI0011F48998|nr:aldo/keto reductase [Mesorhizobium sp.]TIS56407.1 MAG: aldo/keto reductase [Mesorhizobium sp.]
MQKRRLGQTDLSIAPLVLGGNVFGWTADEKTSFELLDRFVGAGLNAVDTADSYSRWVPGNKGGESETIIGKWMKSRGNRDQVVVITKVGSDMGQGKKDLSAAYIEKAIDASLKRLQTDVVDLYLSHWPDSATPYEETLGAYQKLLAKGKIRYAGASNLDAGQLRAALDVASLRGLPRYAVSGKYRSEDDLGKSARGDGVKAYLDARGMRILTALDAVSARHSAKQAEVALAWVMARPGVTAPIASATTLDQVDSLVRAASLKISADDMAALDKASA